MQEQLVIVCVVKVFGVVEVVLFVVMLSVGGKIEIVFDCCVWSCDFIVVELKFGVSLQFIGSVMIFVMFDVVGVIQQVLFVDDSQIDVCCSWFIIDGKFWEGGMLKEGDMLIVEFIIEVCMDIFDVLVIDLLFGGLEVENFNFFGVQQWVGVVIDGIDMDQYDLVVNVVYEEYCDDCYVVVLKFECGDVVYVFYFVCVVMLGIYVVLLLLVEDMYCLVLCGIGKVELVQVKVVEL